MIHKGGFCIENKKYVVCRDDIYVGEVIKIRNDRICRNEGKNNFFYTKPGQLYPSVYKSCRSMLFVPNENNFSNDLLYKSPNYPVLNVTDDDICLNLSKDSIVVTDAYNLSFLLEYFGYKKDLTIEDIMKIRKIFFTGRFGMDNCRLFGMEEFIPSCFEPNVTNLEERYELYKKSVNLGSERQFGSISTNELPRELMDLLDERGRCAYGYTFDDSFKPSKEEGPIKRLKIF